MPERSSTTKVIFKFMLLLCFCRVSILFIVISSSITLLPSRELPMKDDCGRKVDSCNDQITMLIHISYLNKGLVHEMNGFLP